MSFGVRKGKRYCQSLQNRLVLREERTDKGSEYSSGFYVCFKCVYTFVHLLKYM